LNALFARWPSVHRFYFQTRYLLQIAREVYFTDPVAMNDRSHREQEWNFGAGPDKDRWQRVLALVRSRVGDRWGDVLEIGCAEGLVSAEIAQHAATLVAGDISPFARQRAADRLRGFPHARVVPLDLRTARLQSYDVVFAMDVLEFVHGRRSVARTVDLLAGAVRPGGLLVVSMCRYAADIRAAWWQRWVPEGADQVLPLVARHPAFQQLDSEPHPADGRPIEGYLDHLIALYRRQ